MGSDLDPRGVDPDRDLQEAGRDLDRNCLDLDCSGRDLELDSYFDPSSLFPPFCYLLPLLLHRRLSCFCPAGEVCPVR